MIFTCRKCGNSYDTGALPTGQPVKCTCGDVLFVPAPVEATQAGRIAAYLDRLSREAGKTIVVTSSGEGVWEFPFGSARVRLAADTEAGTLSCSASIMPLPTDGERRMGLMEAVLALNAAKTQEARFAVADETLMVISLRSIEGLDYPEFVSLLQSVGRVADDYDDALRTDYGGPAARESRGGAKPLTPADLVEE
ncbi:MAG: YbjN domain-containing protein [Planctomycetes bacterium]|nr:YbjN domain-containing protein [Planctomycetota bacterium]